MCDPTFGYQWLLRGEGSYPVGYGNGTTIKTSFNSLRICARVYQVAYERIEGARIGAIKEFQPTFYDFKVKEFRVFCGPFLPLSPENWHFLITAQHPFISEILLEEKIEGACHWKGYVLTSRRPLQIEVALPGCKKWDELSLKVFQTYRKIMAYVKFDDVANKEEIEKMFVFEEQGEALTRQKTMVWGQCS